MVAPLGQKQRGNTSCEAANRRNEKKCNSDDRRLRRIQGGAVGAAVSRTRVPLKARSGHWAPQPVLAQRLAFFRFDNSFGIIKGEQPLIRASRASKVAGAFLVLFWHAKENLALLQNRSKPAPLARNFTAHFRAKNLTATCISHTPPASQSRAGYRNAPARGCTERRASTPLPRGHWPSQR